MIRVPRSPKPASLDGRAAARERLRAAHYFETPLSEGDARKPFKFKAYSAEDVKKTLESMFHRKCAYCESRYAATQPVDVEHWRPKAEVVDANGSARGYYWLASSWENLLPSCIDCNRERKQFVEPDVERVVGKANRFPVKAARASRPEELSGEDPLLLDPCDPVVDPADHLEFASEGVVRAAPIGGIRSERGAESIEVYALNRSGLVLERLERLRLIQLGIQRIEILGRLLEAKPSPTGRRLDLVEDLIAHEMNTLRNFCEAPQPYAQMARQIVEAFFRKRDGT